jgi:hypothetical protein
MVESWTAVEVNIKCIKEGVNYKDYVKQVGVLYPWVEANQVRTHNKHVIFF